MKLTTKGHYAVTAMLDLALYAELKPVSLAEIAERQSISVSYLEQLVAKLRQKGLLVSIRGPGGGYQLAQSRSDVSIAAILDAVEEPLDATRCHGQADCQDGHVCLTHNLWDELNRRLYDFLREVTLESLMQQTDKAGPKHKNYELLDLVSL